MNRKKVIFLLISLAFVIGFAPSVLAAATDYMPDILENFFKWLFFTLPEQARNGNEAFVIYFKLILWLLIFPIVFFGANKIFPDSRRIAGVIAGIFALIAVIFIPKGILIFIFAEFSAVTSILMALAPVFIGLFVRSKIPDDLPMMKNGLMVLIGVLLIMVGGYFTAYHLSDESTNLFDDLGAWSTFFGAFAIIWGLGGFLFGFGMGKGESKGYDFGLDKDKEKREEKEREKLEDKEKKEATANTRMLQLASEIGNVDQKLQEIDSAELKQIMQEMKTYEQHQPFLENLERTLLNTWNAEKALYSAVNYYKQHPQAFKEREEELEQNFKKFRSFMVRLGEILTAYKNSLESQESLTRKIEGLEGKHRSLEMVIGNISRWDLRAVRSIFGQLEKGEKDRQRLEELKGKSTNEARTIRLRERLLANEMKALQDLRQEDDNLGKMFKEEKRLIEELRNLENEDIRSCERNLEKISRFSMIGSFWELVRGIKTRFIWLSREDVRLLFNDVSLFKSHTKRKIEINGELVGINNNRQQIEKHIEEIDKVLLRFDTIFRAQTLKEIEKLKPSP